MIRLGAPVSGAGDDPEALAREHVRRGYRAAYCPAVAIEDRDRIAAIRRAFAAGDVTIAEVGAWRNLVPPEPEKRRANQEYVRGQLALADEVGARCCVDFLGTAAPGSEYGPHPANLSAAGFDLAVETVRAVIDGVKPRRARFCLEMMQWVLPDSVDSYLALIRAVDRPAFAAHLDPVNLVVSPRMYFDTGSLLRDCFARLGPWVVSCHAKDIVLQGRLAMHLDEVAPGLGAMDYPTYLAELNRLPDTPPLLLEHLASQEEYAGARDRLLGIARTAGIEVAGAG